MNRTHRTDLINGFDIAEYLGRTLTAPIWFEALEIAAALAALAVSLLWPAAVLRLTRGLETRLGGLARRPWLAGAALFFGLIALRLALLPLMPPPVPSIQDEFAYLVGGDTFASGRMANPPHPFWRHFEVNYVLWQPVYAPKYPPGQSLSLAAGQRLFGQPWAGVLLVSALLYIAVWWMMRAWLPPGWALLGASLAALRLGLFSYWTNSYWGGALAALGGALLLGAAGRIVREPSATMGAVAGLGLVILANTRPYEGLCLAVPVGMLLLAWGLFQRRYPRILLAARVGLPLGAVLLAGFVLMGYYFWRVTGDPAKMPYSAYEGEHAWAPSFLFQQPRPKPVLRNPMMERHNSVEMEAYLAARSVAGTIRRNVSRALANWSFFFGPLFTLSLLFAIRSLWDRPVRALTLLFAAAAAGVCLETFWFPHYAAPLAPLAFTLFAWTLSRLDTWRPLGRPAGAALARAIPVALIAVLALRLAAQPWFAHPQSSPPPFWQSVSWCCTGPGDQQRAMLKRRLDQIPGRHLVFVHYRPNHPSAVEWVYNAADIDRSKVVWANDLSPEEDDALMRYYPDRDVWLVDPDQRPTEPRLLRAGSGSPASARFAD